MSRATLTPARIRRSNIAAESRAKIVYERLISLTDDPGVKEALEKHGLTPAAGPVIVTGAAGGVGSVATAVLSKLGYQVIASTGRAAEADYLLRLGATGVIDRAELSTPGKPLSPMIRLNLDLPDGTSKSYIRSFPASTYNHS